MAVARNTKNVVDKMLKTLITLLTIISLAACNKTDALPGDTVKTTFQNPLWDGADPWMTKHGDDYIYCLSKDNSIVVSRSKYITKRTEHKTIWRSPATG